ncbi:AraC family transcriptional regulator [Teredinibacter turnerae]|uniref:AraC family transcriptional regulator n=1 Tax=Teredinibacter turnerae TaxID=2426 RepID=UPI0003A05B2A|nr:AraC family transcriptional regulator [Teredinibacter turnerae]
MVTNTAFPRISDPLGEILYQLRMDGSLYAQSYLSAPWGVEMPELPGKMMFHIITQGQCWLHVEAGEPVLLRQGSLVLVPHGRGHRVMDAPGSPVEKLFDLPIQRITDRYEELHYGGGGASTHLTCCVMSFDPLTGRQLIPHLPDYLHIDSWDTDVDSWLQTTLRFIAREAREQKPGGQTIIANLADILVIQAIRAWLDSTEETSAGWLAALRDKYIGSALAAIHREPERNWTVDTLAREVGLSRSGFSARFSELVGESAKRYITHWRMQLARSKLLESGISMGELADQLGYHSEAAFCRAFKRVIGVSPGSIKKSALSLS